MSAFRLRAALLGTVLASTCATASAQLEKPSIRFSQGWLFQATQAQFPLAYEKGYWKTQGLQVEVDRGSGSATSVQRVIAGTHDLAYADVGTIVKWNAENPDKPLLAVYVAEDGFPLGAYALKAKGITKPKDLEGKTLGAPPFDGGRQMFPVFASVNAIDTSKITWMSIDANLREQMLVKSQVDVITGFVTSAVPTLNSLGVKTADLTVMRYKDFGMDGFGNAVFGTKAFVEKNPKTVTAFVKGVNLALKELIVDPQAAIDALKVRDGLINAATERARLSLYVTELLLTPNVKANGFSAVDPRKLEKQIADVTTAFGIKAPVAPASIYTDRFLPPQAERLPPTWKDQ
jgi:NitT/TauT family transport system substrate-binding protein